MRLTTITTPKQNKDEKNGEKKEEEFDPMAQMNKKHVIYVSNNVLRGGTSSTFRFSIILVNE